MQLQDLLTKTSDILNNYGVKKAAVFGSFARGDCKNNSDIDILVELGRKMSLLDFVGLKLDLEERIGRKIDLVQYKTIKPSLKKYILKDEAVFYKQ